MYVCDTNVALGIYIAYWRLIHPHTLQNQLQSSEIHQWLGAWDVHRYKYKHSSHDFFLQECLPLKPIRDYADLYWYFGAERIINPYPEEDVWIILSLLKAFWKNEALPKIQISHTFSIQLPLQRVPSIGTSLDTTEISITELDNSAIPVSILLTSAHGSMSCTSEEAQDQVKKMNNQVSLSPLDMLLAREFKL